MESPGAKLKQIRLEKGISLEEVHKKTKLHLNILQAVEEDNLANVSPVYIKGFLKIYCKYLGVNPADFIANYKEPQETVRYFAEAEEKPASLMRSAKRQLRVFMPRINIKMAAVAIAAVIAVIGLFGLGKFVSSRRHQLTPQIKPAAVTVSKPARNPPAARQVSSPAAAAVKQAPPAHTEEPPQVISGIRLILRAKADCYVRLKTDGHTVFQNTLKKGRFEAWSAKDKIEFSVGNAGALDLEVNGKPMPTLGRKGQALKNITITKDGLKIP